MAPRWMLVAMIALATTAVTAGAVSAQSRPPTEAETILQQTLRDIDAKARGVKPTTNRQLAQRLQAAAAAAAADRGGPCGQVVRAVLAAGGSQPDRRCRHARRQAVGDVRFRQQRREL